MADTRAIAVFGSSEPVAGEPLYELARLCGGLLAGAGHVVVSGGYGGVMEGACRGALEAGGRTLGVTCRIFSHRSPNPYLSATIETADLHERTRVLIESSRGYLVLPGKAGTLAELSLLWALRRAECLDRQPVVLLGDPWPPLLELLDRQEMLDGPAREITRLAATPQQALRELESGLS